MRKLSMRVFMAAALPLSYIQINPDSWNRTNVCCLGEVSLIYATSNGPMKLESTNFMNFQLLPELPGFIRGSPKRCVLNPYLKSYFSTLVRVKGIGPLTKRWQRLILPLNYTRNKSRKIRRERF